MSEYEQIIDEIVKHGVVVKVDKIVDDNYIPCERKYVGCVVELDFSEHDKVFEDKIAEFEKQTERLMREKQLAYDRSEQLMKTADILNSANQELKKRIAELESNETSELPFDPLECANYLINATYEREASSIEKVIAGDGKIIGDRYSIDECDLCVGFSLDDNSNEVYMCGMGVADFKCKRDNPNFKPMTKEEFIEMYKKMPIYKRNGMGLSEILENAIIIGLVENSN